MSEDNNTSGVSVRETSSAEQFAPAPTQEVAASKGILATARTRTGSIINGRPVAADDIVEVRGMTMPVKTAVAHGFLKENGGKFCDLGPNDAEPEITKAPQKNEPDRSGALEVDGETVEGLTDLAGALTEFGANPVAVIGEFLIKPEGLPEPVKLLARDRGIDEGHAHTHFRTLAASVDAAMWNHAVGRGVSPEQQPVFLEYLLSSVPRSSFVTAIAEAVFRGNTTPFNLIVDNFMVAHGRGRGTAKPGDIRKVGWSGAETDTVEVKGVGRVGLAAARRLQIV